MQAANYAVFVSANQICAGDTKNEIRVRLLNRFGTHINLSGATVTWSAIQDKKQVIDDRSGQVYVDGQVGIRFRQEDVLEPGILYLQFVVTAADGSQEAYPAFGDLFLRLS